VMGSASTWEQQEVASSKAARVRSTDIRDSSNEDTENN
jgi:hypothetical protein